MTRTLRALLLVALVAVASRPVVGQLLVGRQLVTVEPLAGGASLPIPAGVAETHWLGGGRYCRGEFAIDADNGDVLGFVDGALALRDRDGVARWTARGGLAFRGAAPGNLLLFADRVVIPARGGGLIALARADGRELWARPAAPARLVVTDGELLFGAGGVGEAEVLAAHALGNGAEAFRIEVAARPTRIAPAHHGVAVFDADGVTVYDRGGPRLFRVDRAVDELAAGSCWYVRSGDFLTAFDRSGRERWRLPAPARDDELLRLGVAPGGDLLALWWRAQAGGGFRLVRHAAADGSVTWEHVEKRTAAAKRNRGGRLVTVGAGLYVVDHDGATVYAIDAATGAVRQCLRVDDG